MKKEAAPKLEAIKDKMKTELKITWYSDKTFEDTIFVQCLHWEECARSLSLTDDEVDFCISQADYYWELYISKRYNFTRSKADEKETGSKTDVRAGTSLP